MDGKTLKKKSFWKFTKPRNPSSLKTSETAPTNGTLRSLFLDDTALSHGPRRGSLPDAEHSDLRCRRPARECRSFCIPAEAEQSFLQGIKSAGLSPESKSKCKAYF